MPSLPAGKARRLICRLTVLGAVAVLCARCVPVGRGSLAAADDRTYRTGLFAWLVAHDPSALVAWHVPAQDVRRLLPDAAVAQAAGERPCEQTARAHAALVLLASRGDAARDYALDCGVSLYRDDAAVVVVPREFAQGSSARRSGRRR